MFSTCLFIQQYQIILLIIKDLKIIIYSYFPPLEFLPYLKIILHFNKHILNHESVSHYIL